MIRCEMREGANMADMKDTAPEARWKLDCVLVQSDNEAVVVNLNIEPVEKPEDVPWIDPIHRGMGQARHPVHVCFNLGRAATA